MYAIDTNIPVPTKTKRARTHWAIKYPWHKLDRGDSFFVPDGNLKSLRSSASMQKGRTGRKYLVRAVDGGVRIWRLK